MHITYIYDISEPLLLASGRCRDESRCSNRELSNRGGDTHIQISESPSRRQAVGWIEQSDYRIIESSCGGVVSKREFTKLVK